MKAKGIICVVAGGLGLLAGFLFTRANHSRLEDAVWLAEKAELVAAIREAQLANRTSAAPNLNSLVSPPPVAERSAQEILDDLKLIRIPDNPSQGRQARKAIRLFVALAGTGSNSLAVIRPFLREMADVEYALGLSELRQGWKEGKLATDFVLAPSLRLGLLDIVRQTGTAEGEQILAENLSVTGRGLEVAYLASVLQQSAPNRYRDVAIAAAKELLLNPPPASQRTALDQRQAEYLYGVLTLYQDSSFAATAAGLLLKADGTVDAIALNYLESALRREIIPTIAQTFQDPRITDPRQKEILMQAVLSYAGMDEGAAILLHGAVTDQSLPVNARYKMLEDLRKAGIKDFDAPTPEEQRILAGRLQLIEALTPDIADPKLTERMEKTRSRIAATLANNVPRPQ